MVGSYGVRELEWLGQRIWLTVSFRTTLRPATFNIVTDGAIWVLGKMRPRVMYALLARDVFVDSFTVTHTTALAWPFGRLPSLGRAQGVDRLRLKCPQS